MTHVDNASFEHRDDRDSGGEQQSEINWGIVGLQAFSVGFIILLIVMYIAQRLPQLVLNTFIIVGVALFAGGGVVTLITNYSEDDFDE